MTKYAAEVKINIKKPKEKLSETIIIVNLIKLKFFFDIVRTDETKSGRAENISQTDQDRWLLAFVDD